MKSERAALCFVCVALLMASEGQARGDCGGARAVALDIVNDIVNEAGQHAVNDGGGRAAGSDPLEEAVMAELGASQISVCGAPSPDSRLARVVIRSALPGWQRASIRFESATAPALERDLDVSGLPPEARALAIASATDELVRAALADPSMEASATAAPLRVEPDRPDPDRPDPARSRSLPAARPRLELGLSAAGSSYLTQREALEGGLAARYWPLPRLPLTARLGVGQRLSRPIDRGEVQPDADVHGAIGVGYALEGEPRELEIIAEAGLQLSRVGFDERVEVSELVPARSFVDESVTSIRTETASLDHGWGLAASFGLEGRVDAGPFGFSVALTGLAPLIPPRSDWGNQTSLDAFGVQLRASLWLVLDARPTAPPSSAKKDHEHGG